MKEEIQELLDSQNSYIKLPSGEFSGPFIIDHSCTIEGSGTTLWNDSSTVIKITSPGVILKNLKIEVINEGSDDCYAIESSEETDCENVEIIGRVSGFGAEDSYSDTSKQILIGGFRSDEENTFIIEIESPSDAEIICDIVDIQIGPSVLVPGKNEVRITVNSLPHNTYIYGYMIVKSVFNRRYYISGYALNNSDLCCDKKIEIGDKETESCLIKMTSDELSDPQEKKDNQTVSVYHSQTVKSALMDSVNKKVNNQQQEMRIKMPDGGPLIYRQTQQQMQAGAVKTVFPYRLSRGERVFLDDVNSTFKIIMGYRALKKNIVLDPYIFLLDSSGVTSCDEDFVYFGNARSGCGSVTINNDKTMEVDLKKVPDHIKRISLVYSIYLPGINDNFAQIVDPYIRFFQNGKEKYNFIASNLLTETTMIFADFYKYLDTWKLSAVGFGYREGLKKLCSSYGLIVS